MLELLIGFICDNVGYKFVINFMGLVFVLFDIMILLRFFKNILFYINLFFRFLIFVYRVVLDRYNC